jgi:hypothetical protein
MTGSDSNRRARSRRARLGALIGAWLATGGATAGAAPTVERRSSAGSDVSILALDGVLVAVAGDAGALWLLVAPPGEPDAERRLLAWSAAAPGEVEARPTELPGWTKTLVLHDLGSGVELLAGGLGEIATLGAADDAGKLPLRSLLRDPDFDLRSMDRRPLRVGVAAELVAASAGRWRLWRGEAGALRLSSERRLPLDVRAERGGLRLSSPPGALLGTGIDVPVALFGPEAQGSTRVRTLRFALVGDAPVEECWSRLPGAEIVEQGSFLAVDGAPFLGVRTQGGDEVNLLEKQRLRVLPLVPDRTRAGRPATFALELDTRRWHDLELAAADQDGDGKDDLLVARPEGFRGEDLVVEVYAGSGGGRFAPRARRDDFDGPFADFSFAEDLDGDGRVDLAFVRDGWLELRRGAARGGPVEREPWMRVELAPAGAARTTVTIGVGGEGGSATSERAGEIEILGVLPLGDGRSALLATLADETGRQRLAVVSPPAR